MGLEDHHAVALCELLELGIEPGGRKGRLDYPPLRFSRITVAGTPLKDRKAFSKHRMKCSVVCREVALV
ncbi:MAG: hypothetical protein RLZZ313_374 [Verrucomicrobiota bacterium]|jgi:hypothetical protein